MEKILLSRKVSLPPTSSNLIRRPRITNALQLERKVTCVTAPAGYGKTVAAVEALRCGERGVCWLTLDAADRHIDTFATYLRESLASQIPRLREMRDDKPLELRAPELASVLASSVAEHAVGPLVIVLDNFHDVDTSPDVRAFVEAFVRYLPPEHRVMILSRVPPQLPLGRWLVHEEAAVLAEDALRLTSQEARQLAARLGYTDRQSIEQLHSRLDGWVAGFTLLLGSQSAHLSSGYTAEQLLYNYISSEIMDTLSPQARDATALAALFTPCSAAEFAALAPDFNAKQAAEFFQRSQAFYVLTGEDGPRYGCQPLFQDYIRSALKQNRPQRWREFNLSIGRYYLAEGRVEALEHLLDADEPAEILDHICHLQQAAREAGQQETLLVWLRRVPNQTLEQHPDLLILLAEAEINTEPERAALHFMQATETEVRDPQLRAAALTGYLVARHNQGAFQAVIGEGPSTLLALQDLGAPYSLALAYNALGRAHMSLGNFADAKAHFTEVKRIAEALSNDYLHILAQRGLVAHAEYTGDVRQALALNKEILPFWQRTGNELQQLSALNNLASCHHYLGQDARAHARVSEALALAEDGVVTEDTVLLHCTAGDIALAAGRVDEALTHYQHTLHTSGTQQFAYIYATLGAARAQLCQAQEASARWHINHAHVRSQELGFQLTEGLALLLLGHITPREARGHFLQAAEIFRASGALREQVQALKLLLGCPGTTEREQAQWREQLELVEGRLGYTVRLLPPHDADTPEVDEQRAAPSPGEPYQLSIHTMGRLDVHTVAGEVSLGQWQGRKALELVLLLAAHPGGLLRDTILDSLWPDREPDSAKQAFSVALSRARRIVGGKEAIARRGPVYSFGASLSWWEDAGQLEQFREADAKKHAAAILAASQVEYLPGLYAEWIEQRRTQLKHHLLELCTSLLDHAQSEEPELIPDVAAAVLKLDPFHEQAHHACIRYFAARGASRAREHLDRYLAAMRELGAEPDTDVVALVSPAR